MRVLCLSEFWALYGPPYVGGLVRMAYYISEKFAGAIRTVDLDNVI